MEVAHFCAAMDTLIDQDDVSYKPRTISKHEYAQHIPDGSAGLSDMKCIVMI